ncbi:MAG: glycosyl hydrolase family 3, partial [Clostridiales bacterium]|nr:glycosyl hydrolase family 3 [Clostridiales bacterium]
IMAGFTQAMPRERAIPADIAEGADLLVFSTDIYEDYQYMLDGIKNGLLSEKRLDEAVTRILAMKTRLDAMSGQAVPGIPAKLWQRECADKAVTLVKNNQDILPISPERFPTIRLVTFGNDDTVDGSMTGIARELLQKEGFKVEVFDIDREDMHGTKDLDPHRLTLCLANCEQASNQTVVRLFWAKKHALDVPRHVWEEPSIFVSFSNPYHLQDVPRVKTYINAYSCHRPMIEAVIEKLMGRSEFKGISPVDAFCGLPDTHI